MGWTRKGRKGAFRYFDGQGRQIREAAKIERIEQLAIPPAWKDVLISPRAKARLQATGYDKAGRKQYLYHADFRAAQEQAKYDNLIRFAEKLPVLRGAMAAHLDKDGLDRERVSAIALRLINLGWFRVGSERYARESRTYRDPTLTRRHVEVRGKRIRLVSAASMGSRCVAKSWMRSSRPRCESSWSFRAARGSSATSRREACTASRAAA
jgi:DNA topoisomerase IB